MSRHETSVKFLESRLNENPQSLVFSRLADGIRESGHIQQAISVCMDGLARHPDCLTGRVVLGRCYLEQENLKEAAAEFVAVLKLDRRNHTAIKMIADICARQGLKEKAGDLYASLLCMDPDNQSLVELASTFRGTGDTDLFSILGMSSVAGRVAVAPAPAADDTVADADRTIEFDVEPSRAAASAGEDTEVGEMMAKTQQFDPKDLGIADRAHDDTVLTSDVLTGDDVSPRMETMFESARKPRLPQRLKCTSTLRPEAVMKPWAPPTMRPQQRSGAKKRGSCREATSPRASSSCSAKRRRCSA